MLVGMLLMLFSALCVLLGLQSAGVLTSVLDIPSLVIVLGGSLALLLASFSSRELAEAVGFALSTQKTIPRRKAVNLSLLYNAAGDYGLYTGLLGSFIGLALMLSALDDPGKLGPYCAVCSITLIYGFTLHASARLAGRKLKMCPETEQAYDMKPRNRVLMVTIGVLLFLAILILGIYSGGDFAAFGDPGSLVLIIPGSVLGLLLFVRFRDLKECAGLLLGSEIVSEESTRKVVGAFAQYNDIVTALMIIGAASGFTGVIQRINDPSEIGPPLAFAVLCVFYGLVLISISRAKEYALRCRLAGAGLTVESEPRINATKLTGITLIFYLLVMGVLFYCIPRF